MERIRLTTYGLLIFLYLLTSVEGLQTSNRIGAFGKIEYSSHALALKRFTGSHYFGDMEANKIAELFDMSSEWWWDETRIRQVHQIRPDFKALLYRNIRAIYNTRLEEWQTAFENNWLLRDENGSYVYDTIYPRHSIVDIGNTSYQVWVANWIREHINEYGYDGVFADWSLNILASGEFSGASAIPINPRTGASWKDEEVKQALIQLHREIKKAIGSKVLVCNGIFVGSKFWRNYDGYTQFLLDSPLDGIMSEGLWYQYRGVWMTEENWLKSLNMLIWFQDNFLIGRPERVFVPTCKLESFTGEPYPLPSDATKEQMATYAFASTLLSIKTNQTYFCLNADVNFTTRVVQPMYKVVVGSPVSDYYVINGTHVYVRDFSKMKVLVNPTSNSYMVDLQEAFKTFSGEIVTEITIEPHAGVILIKGEAP